MFSAGSGGSESSSGSTAGREILVQHLLVREDDLKLLLELQKRITQGLFLVLVYFLFDDHHLLALLSGIFKKSNSKLLLILAFVFNIFH